MSKAYFYKSTKGSTKLIKIKSEHNNHVIFDDGTILHKDAIESMDTTPENRKIHKISKINPNNGNINNK